MTERCLERSAWERGLMIIVLVATACGGKKHPGGAGAAAGSAGSAAAADVIPVDWASCTTALRQAAAVPPGNRPKLVIDGCQVCGDWTPILDWAKPQNAGGPERTLIQSALDRCHAFCTTLAKEYFMGTLDEARGTEKRRPWRYLGEQCKADVSAVPDNRFTNAPTFALDRIARAAVAHGGDTAALAQALELPLPAVSLSSIGIELPDVGGDAVPAAGPIAITLIGSVAYVAKLPRAHMTANGLAIDLGNYPGDAVTPDTLGAALAKLAEPKSSITVLAPPMTPAAAIVPLIAAAAKAGPVYLGAKAPNPPEGWVLPGNIAVQLSITSGGGPGGSGSGSDALAMSANQTVEQLATELAARAKSGAKQLALAAAKAR